MSPVVADGGPGQPAVHRGLARLRPARGLRHRPGAGAPPRRTSPGWSGPCSMCAGTSVRRGGLHGPGRRPGGRAVWCARTRPGCGPRHDAGPPGARCSPSMRPACCCSLPAPYDVPMFATGEGPPRLPRRGRPGAVLGAEGVPGLPPGRPRRHRAGQAVPPRAAGQDPPAPAARPAGSPTRPTCPRRRPPTRCATSLRWPQAARRHGDAIGVYAERLLDDRPALDQDAAVYRLLGLVRRYGPGPGRHRLRSGPSTSTSSTSPRSPRCWRRRPRTHRAPPRPAGGCHRPVRPRPRRIPGRAS